MNMFLSYMLEQREHLMQLQQQRQDQAQQATEAGNTTNSMSPPQSRNKSTHLLRASVQERCECKPYLNELLM